MCSAVADEKTFVYYKFLPSFYDLSFSLKSVNKLLKIHFNSDVNKKGKKIGFFLESEI